MPNNVIKNDDINLQELTTALWKGKWFLIIITFLFSTASVFYALSLPNIYKSEVLLVPAEENKGGGMSGLASQFGGLASMAGINLGGNGNDKTTLALEILKSRSFIGTFIQDNNLKASLIAANGWDISRNKLLYNPDIYDETSQTWKRKVTAPLKAEPSDLEIHEYFLNNNLAIITDKKTELIRVSIKHVSPFIAKDIVDKLITSINDKMKKDDIDEANKSIKYLRKGLNDTSLSEMKKVFYQLIEQQEQTKMLASVREQYVLKTIDPAVVTEIKESPKRALICILATLLGGALSLFIVFVRHFYFKP